MTKPVANALPNTVRQFLTKNGITEETRLLVGVSGGMDSMVLINILYALEYNISVSHINFNLRAEESDMDAAFVKDWCSQRSIPFLILNKITKTVEAELHINTQTAARKIRYDWWDKLVSKHQFDFVCTAHHLDDSIETLLLNLFRGSGMKGLRGIPKKRDHYLRPLLACPKSDIEAYANQYEIPFRIDSSNLTDAYRRNRIRHHIIPLLEEIYPNLHTSMSTTITRLNTEWETMDFMYSQWVTNHVQSVEQGVMINTKQDTSAFVLRWLEEQGFPWPLAADFVLSPNQHTGHFLAYDQQRLSRTDFGYFLEDFKTPVQIAIPHTGKYSFEEFEFTVEEIKDTSEMHFDDPWTVYVSPSALQWPLMIRSVQPGDVFQPFGMEGKHKKIQDLMVDLKLEMFEKNRLLLLENNEHIVWVIGKRLDERARVLADDHPITRLKFELKSMV